MTFGKTRELAITPPDIPSPIIPAQPDGETGSIALFDLKVCASLPLLFAAVVAVFVMPPPWPTAVSATAGGIVVSVLLSLLARADRSHLRIVRVRFRRG
ncbi:hypothetical protein AB0G74_08805 [Streptomyces sp. NPDC020875]|uniref:hypothetical protein n=1 Tax=Streptomyces sp. NPDC020875 TaxID=3154898 RepID=UPI0033F996CE